MYMYMNASTYMITFICIFIVKDIVSKTGPLVILFLGSDEEHGGCPMEIEIILCQYKHPTPEVTVILHFLHCIFL